MSELTMKLGRNWINETEQKNFQEKSENTRIAREGTDISMKASVTVLTICGLAMWMLAYIF